MRYPAAILVIALATIGLWLFFLNPTPVVTTAHLNTWTIVALDPATGDVGIAGASCVPVPIDAIAALVPGKGVATTQAAFFLDNRNVVRDAIINGTTAPDALQLVLKDDESTEDRQYGIVTLDNGAVQVVAYTGSDNSPYAGAITDTVNAVSVQGNILEGEDVLQAAYEAYIDDSLGPVYFSDRLMRAVEAGSSEGGDKRCNQQDVTQTAAASFIMVARAGDTPYSAENFGFAAPNDPAHPWLSLSVSNPVLGTNPVPDLRRQYDAWRATALPACDTCNLAAYAPLPEGAQPDTLRSIRALVDNFIGPIFWRFMGLVFVAIAVIIAIILLHRAGRL